MGDEEGEADVRALLDALAAAYEALIARHAPDAGERARLLAVADDLRWYAERLGPSRWHVVPRPEKWSFARHMEHVATQAAAEALAPAPAPVRYFIDHGKEHVGQAAELVFLVGGA